MIVKIALTPAFSLLPLLVSEHFGGGAGQLGLMESVAGVGALVGGLILSAWGGFRRKIYTTMMGVVVLGLSLFAMGLTPADRFWAALASMSVVGLMIPFTDGPFMAILQGNVAPEMQGRVFTLVMSLLWITSPFSLAVAGPVSDWLGLRVWYIVAGVTCGVVGLAGFFVPVIANMEENNQTTGIAESGPLGAASLPTE